MGTSLRVADEVVKRFADLQVAAIVSYDVDGTSPWPEVTARVAELERALAEGAWQPAGEEDPRVQEWHLAYRQFGTNPRRQRPSVDALGRRLARTGRLPRISPAVDSYNLVSVTHALPIGAYDVHRVGGDITVRFARVGDTFTPLGEPYVTEVPRPGEVIYAVGANALTRHWNHQDAECSKVTSTSRSILFLLETTRGSRRRTELLAAADDLRGLLASHGRSHAPQVLDAAHPRLDLSQT